MNWARSGGPLNVMNGNDTEEVLSGSGSPRPFRVFLASPGDVPLERKLAREAIAHIGSERRFRGRIDIEIVAWDQPGAAVAMEAGLTPQEAIAQGLPKPEDCDLAVIVLWSRIGTPLPAEFELKDDGTPYHSGTEWEYLNALKGYKTRRKPAVWIYRRNGAPQFAADDPELSRKLEQWRRIERFFEGFTNPDGSLARGINHYDAPDDFRQQFEQHLRDRLDKLLETLPDPESQTTGEPTARLPMWHQSPYPGLPPFAPEQAPIFFGRGKEIDQLLRQFSDPRVRFVAVVGVSGAGKSSLVMAGLLPRLRTGIVGAAPWVDLYLKPGQRGGDPFLALAYAIKSELKISAQTELEIARASETDPQCVPAYFADLLAKHEPAGELLLVVDQFEELFTPQAPADKARALLALLEHLSAQPRLRVIITLRADFYPRAIEEPVLARLLRRDGGTFPLDPPGMAALHEMIVRPAEAAGVELEDGLAQRLLDEAGAGPGAMALIAFTLNQLYERAPAPKSHLTIEAYDAFGGVQGAVERRAEAALQGLPVHADRALEALFPELVEVNVQEIATRRRASKANLPEDARTVAEALTEARLLVSSEGQDGQPMVEVGHEVVLNGWKRLRDWISVHAEALRARRDLERAADEWDRAGRHGGDLRGGRSLQRYQHAAKPHTQIAEAYLRACRRRRDFRWAGLAVLAVLLVGALGLVVHVNGSAYPPALASKALFVELGVLQVPQPKMTRIPAGEFEMGDLDGSGFARERPVRPIRFANDFEIGTYAVTFDEYDLFAAATGRDKPGAQQQRDEFRGKHPVINVSWDDARAYASWLSKRTGLHYRLPSEAEWEYVARAGTRTPRHWEESAEGQKDAACQYANVFDTKNEADLKRLYNITWEAFHCKDDFPYTAPVGSFLPNDWGLYDMLGNVWEWVEDCYFDSYDGAPRDGLAREPDDGSECSLRVLRGGSWGGGPRFVRSAYRYGNAPDDRYDNFGFRLARTL
jgi:formylglycine-generating enzyme required for sulfatase activity